MDIYLDEKIMRRSAENHRKFKIPYSPAGEVVASLELGVREIQGFPQVVILDLWYSGAYADCLPPRALGKRWRHNPNPF